MKSNNSQPLFAEERKEKILQLLKDNTKILVPELCNIFQVSPATIRNDLRDLENEGSLRRTHGGAIPVGKASFEPNYTAKEISYIDEKQKIARYAADLIEDGDTIAIDCGTTMFELAKCLTNKKNLTIVLNDIKIVAYLESNTDHEIILIGGIVRHGLKCTVGPMAIASLTSLNVDKAFMATNAFSTEKGFTTPDINQSEIKKAIMATAAERIILCDSSKIGKISFVQFATVHDFDKFITDSNVGTKVTNYINETNDNIEIFIV